MQAQPALVWEKIEPSDRQKVLSILGRMLVSHVTVKEEAPHER